MSWPLVALEKVADIVGGSTPSRSEPRYWGPGHFWVTPTDLPMPGEGILALESTKETITDEGLNSISANVLPIGTVLYSTRATIGKLAIANVPVVTNQGFNNLIARPEMYNRYLAYALQFFTPEISRLAGSTTFKEVSRSSLRVFRVPLPPQKEQRRIAEILDQADVLRHLRREADAKAARILPALFVKMFGDPASNPMDWPMTLLGEVASVSWGNTAITKASYTDEGFTAFSASGSDGLLPFFEHDEAGIILSAIGARCGKCFLASGKWTAIKNTITVTQPADDISMLYLMQVLNGEEVWPKRGGGQPFIALGDARALPIPMPPKPLQERFERIAAETRRGLNSLESAAVKIEGTFNLLLQHAFSGRLTAAWREAHMRELLAEMHQQAKAMNLAAPKEVTV